MDRFIARTNIERYRKLLATEADATKRQQVLALLAEEEKALEHTETRHKEKST